MSTPRSALGFLAAALSCAAPAPALEREGDPCRTLQRDCVDDNTLQRCEDEQWTTTSCDELCAAGHPEASSLGCEPKGLGEDDCACAPPPGGCLPGESSCVGEDELELCAQDWQWTTLSCSEACAQQAALISLGCIEDEGNASCSCTYEGASCTAELSRCIDDSTLASCESGVWSYGDCGDVCEGGEGKCVPALAGC